MRIFHKDEKGNRTFTDVSKDELLILASLNAVIWAGHEFHVDVRYSYWNFKQLLMQIRGY